MTAIALKKNVPGFTDQYGFHPIRSASYVGGKTSRRTAKAKDRKKYSRAKAGDLGPVKQERALEDVFSREIRLQIEAKERQKRDNERLEAQITREVYGETSGRTSSGKGKTLAQFVRSEGGINVKTRIRRGVKKFGDLENFTNRGSGSRGLVTTTPGKGKSLDYMYQSARESGYDIGSMDELLDGIDNELRGGKKVYSTHGFMTYNPRKTKNPSVAQTILEQLGGNKFVAMTGAKNFGSSGKSLSFRLPSRLTKNGISYVVVSLTAQDLYDVEYGKIRGAKKSVVRISKGVFNSELRSDFTRTTGLDTSLGTMGKKNPIDPITAFAAGASGILSAIQIHKMVSTKRKTAKRTAKKANPTKRPTLKAHDGILYMMTIGSGDDTYAVYLHDGKANGFDKRFASIASAKSYATRTKAKLVQNPAAVKANGIISRAWARSKAKREYARELRLAAAAERSRKRRQGHEAKAKANPKKAVSGKRKAVDLKLPHLCTISGVRGRWTVRKGKLILGIASTKESAVADAREMLADIAKSKKNPVKVPHRRTFSMFQGRPATKVGPMMVSNHAPANLDALGDLVELKINGGPAYKFGRGVKLCAAGGKLWIAGKRFAKPNPSEKVNVINPIGEIDHVVYGTHKPHHGDHDYTHYIHKLGEESGKRPILCVDREGFPVIRGGNYKIEARGIVD